ncbi:MAG: hypothetical protein EXS31_15330 [Pedosphaera sp.]|nr:hypothetical protein [Pedosphaera sp.]
MHRFICLPWASYPRLFVAITTVALAGDHASALEIVSTHTRGDLSGASATNSAPIETSKAPLADSRGTPAVSLLRMPLHFEANRGQTDPSVQFLARGQGYSLFLTPTEAVLKLSPSSEAGEHTRPRVSRDAPRVPLPGAWYAVGVPEFLRSPKVFRESAENYARGGRAPHSTSDFGLSSPRRRGAPDGTGSEFSAWMENRRTELNPVFGVLPSGGWGAGPPVGGTPNQSFQTAAGPETATVRISFRNSNPHPTVSGLDELSGKVNYFRGSDPSKWRTNVTTYAKVNYHEVYSGIDLGVRLILSVTCR